MLAGARARVWTRLQKVVWHPPGYERFACARGGVELEEGVFEVLVDLHDGRLVAAAVAVVGRRKDGDHVAFLRPVEAVHDELVRARHEREAIVVVERLRDVLTKRVAGTARRDAPATAVVRVGPQQIAHGTLVRHFLDAVDGADVVERVDGW